jgi:hypothetical protein
VNAELEKSQAPPLSRDGARRNLTGFRKTKRLKREAARQRNLASIRLRIGG